MIRVEKYQHWAEKNWVGLSTPGEKKELFDHCLRVRTKGEVFCVELGITGKDKKRIVDACLLHDIGRGFTGKALIDLAKERKIEIYDADKENPIDTLHGRVGAEIARDNFKIEDEQLLKSIALHTFGDPEMDLIAMLVSLADDTENQRAIDNENKINEIKRAIVLFGLDGVPISYFVSTVKKGRSTFGKAESIHPLLLKNYESRRKEIIALLSSGTDPVKDYLKELFN